jgi:hypothetical protein
VGRYGIYFIFMERPYLPHHRAPVSQDSNHRILAHQPSRFTHYYFCIRDVVLEPIIVCTSTFFPFHATYWLNGHSSSNGNSSAYTTRAAAARIPLRSAVGHPSGELLLSLRAGIRRMEKPSFLTPFRRGMA